VREELKNSLRSTPIARQGISMPQSRENEGVHRAVFTSGLNGLFEFRDSQLGHAFLFVVPAENHLFPGIVGCLFKTSSANWMELSY